MENDDNIVTLSKYNSQVDAEIVKGALEQNGIIAGVMGDATANALLQGFPQGAYRVVVFERDLEKARQIIGDDTSC
ncbi:MAG: DUF2007 domain-containing protein [Muribaculaceae bacterium]|nr:DUF2007 domain-containing protein [Muribaculaceae bacterium]